MRAGVFLLLCLILASCGGARPYPSETGIVVYDETWPFGATETHIWDDWGMRQVIIRNGVRRLVGGRSIPRQTRTIVTPDAMYTYTSGSEGYLRVNAGSRRLFASNGRSRTVDAGTETIAGMECQARRSRNPSGSHESCTARRLLLRLRGSAGERIATSVQLDVPVNPAIFEVEGPLAAELSEQDLRRIMSGL